MALTRAQLLMGDGTQGPLLTGQVRAVKAGAGISIDSNGIITVDSQTVVGVMKLGQSTAQATAAYNGYNWPTATGTVGQQLTIASVAGGITGLAWDDPDMIPWTAKGQLVVGTGANAQTILNVGTDGQILIADSGAGSGLSYTSNYVSTTGATGAANIPAGTTGQQPLTPNTGALRYNSTLTSLEFYNGSFWEVVASSSTNGFVEKTSDTGAALIPAGTIGQRPAPGAGYFRFNDDTDHLEFWNGTSWQEVVSGNSPTPPIPGSVTSIDVSGGTTGFSFSGGPITTTGTLTMTGTLGLANGGTGGTTQQTAINNLLPLQAGNAGEFLTTDGTNVSWSVTTQPATLAQAQAGALTTVYSSPQTSVPKDASGMTGSAYIPAGTTAERPAAAAYAGQFRYNKQIPQLEYSDGVSWIAVGGNLSPATLAEAAAGTLTSVYSSPQTSVPKNASGMTGAAILPTGTSAQQPGGASAGWIRFNTTRGELEFFTGTAWVAATRNVVGAAGTYDNGATIIAVGTTPQQPTASTVQGAIRYNTTIPQMEYSDGVSWLPLGGGATAATLAEAAAGTINTKFLSPETGVPKDAAGMTGAAILPGGSNAQRPAGASGGWVRWNNTTTSTVGSRIEVYDPTFPAWRPLEYATTPPTSANFTVTNGMVLSGIYRCRNFTCAAGVTATIDGSFTVEAQGNVTIAGTLNGDGAGPRGSQVYGTNYSSTLPVNVFGGNGTGTSPGVTNFGGPAFSPSVGLVGSGGSGGFVGSTGYAGGTIGILTSPGGNAGASVLIRAQGTITVTGAINANGQTPSTPGSPDGLICLSGGGGGSGGVVVLDANGNCTNSGTISANGGNGGNAVNGNARGGGGGGGGIVIIQSRFGTQATGTVNVNGGAAGVSAGAGIGGGGGGGCGGAGGSAGGPVFAGQVGDISTFGSPFK